MALEQISSSPGWYKCSVTGYVGKEVTDVIQLVRANGAIMLDDNGGVMWLAGRDLRHAILSVKSKLGLVAAPTLEQLRVYLSAARVFNGTHLDEVEHSLSTIGSLRQWKTGAVTRAGQRLLAAPNRLFAGSFYSTGYNFSVVGAPYNSTAIIAGGDPRATALGRSPTIASVSFLDDSAIGSPSRYTPGRSPEGVGIVQVPLGQTWEKWLATAFASLRNSSESEVAKKMAPVRARMLAYLKSFAPGPVMNIPVGRTASGGFKVAMPRSLIHSSLVNPLWSTPSGSRFVQPVAFGAQAFNEEGYTITCPLGYDNQGSASKSRGYGSIGTTAYASSTANSDWLDGTGFLNSGGIDNIPFSWFFGVLDAPAANINGTFQTPVGPFTSRDTYLAAYRASITPDSYTKPNPQTVDGKTESEMEMWTRIASTNPPPEPYHKVGISSWDQQGPSHGLASVLFAQAINDESYSDSLINAVGKHGVCRPAVGGTTPSRSLSALGARDFEAFSAGFAALFADPAKIGVVA